MMKRFSMALAAAALIAAPAFAQEGAADAQEIDIQALLAQMQRPAPAKAEDIEAALPDTIGKVYGKDVTKADFMAFIGKNESILYSIGAVEGDELKSVLQNVVDQYLYMEMIKGLLTKENALISLEQMKGEISKEIAQIPAEHRSSFDAMLEQRGITEEQLIDEIAGNEDARLGASFQKWAEKLAEDNKIGNDEAVRAYYDENKEDYALAGDELGASHILFSIPADATPEEEAKMLEEVKAVLARIEAGEKLEDLAAELSDCPSKARGGDLGFFRPEQMVSEFSQAVIMLEDGEIAKEPVRTQFGFHIVRRNAIPKYVEFDDVKANIKQMLVGDYINDYLEKVREENLVNLVEAPEVVEAAE